jgi:hypothetical protein
LGSDLWKSEWTAFILVVPAAYGAPSQEQLEVLPPFTITKEHAEQASRNYLVFDLEAGRVTVAVF